MAQSVFDQNRVSTLIGVSSVDGITPVAIKVDSVTGRLLMSINSMGALSGITNRQIAYRDQNRVTVALGESSADDGELLNLVFNSPGIMRVKAP